MSQDCVKDFRYIHHSYHISGSYLYAGLYTAQEANIHLVVVLICKICLPLDEVDELPELAKRACISEQVWILSIFNS